MEINGVPLHPLVVHAVVVLTPLVALTALVYAVVPRWRWLLRWPLVLVSVAALGAAFVATYTGQGLLDARPYLRDLSRVTTHQKAGKLLRLVMVGFTPVALLAAWRLGGPSALVSGRGSREQRGGAVDLMVTGLLVVAALVVLVAVFLAGDSGARAVWGK